MRLFASKKQKAFLDDDRYCLKTTAVHLLNILPKQLTGRPGYYHLVD
jgi:hypothetical protein